MEAIASRSAGWAASLLRWLTGPIFDKEMRVSSRRRRNYLLRFLYIGAFTFTVAVMWADRVAHRVSPGYSSVYQVSRMAAVGQEIVTAILWFQFLTCQVIAIVMLSTSISDEIYKRTLGTLMTTPIGSFQIVVGKLTSKLLQIVLLLAISLPMLAIVRVFGGVPWSYLLCGLCVTLTTAVFVGSLSLFFSIFTRRAYTAIIETMLTTGLLFGVLPALVLASLASFKTSVKIPINRVHDVLSYANPYLMMVGATESLSSARLTIFLRWPRHCAVMLGASLLLLLLAMVCVRRAALRQAVGQAADARGRKTKSRKQGRSRSSGLRRVVGPPVLWKELRTPLLGNRRVTQILAALLLLVLLALTYGLCAKAHLLKAAGTHVAYIIVFLSAGLLFTMVLPATCITTERESQTWTLLLTTPLGRWEILWGKAVGAMRAVCAPAWLLLFGHLLAFAVAGIIHPIALVQMGVLLAWVLLFLTCTGLYFSTWLRHTTTAVIANMALAAALWAIVPLILAILLGMSGASDRAVRVYMDLNPFTQAGVIMSAVVYKGAVRGSHQPVPPHGLAAYDWMQGGMNTLPEATGWIVLTFAVYVALGLVFFSLAAARLRRSPF